ncbi:MAG TPA: DNA oxidative demethylase AlkB [Magnetospirillaceae bacterium]|jgi:alkylated DNA repair protein (DNA oxidative demethylase)
MTRTAAIADLFAEPLVPLAPGAVLLRGFARDRERALIGALPAIAAVAPFRHMVVPMGHKMSVAMTNCGDAGWVTDRKGYRYAKADPETDKPWPPMPPVFVDLAVRAAAAAGYADFAPDSCLINRYEPGAKMGLHKDLNEGDLTKPIVSVSLGLPATFLFGGAERKGKPQRLALESGDVVIWGGPSRLFFHGVDPVEDGQLPLTGALRYNLTFRKAL